MVVNVENPAPSTPPTETENQKSVDVLIKRVIRLPDALEQNIGDHEGDGEYEDGEW